MSKTTVVVQFGDSVAAEEQFAVVELDDTMNLDADGEAKTQFHPGDEVVFLVHLKPGLYIDRTASTDGGVVSMGPVSLAREQDILFADDSKQSLSYYPVGAVIKNWQGAIGSGVKISGREISIEAGWPALLSASYKATFSRFKLVPPEMELAEDESYHIYVVVYVEAEQ